MGSMFDTEDPVKKRNRAITLAARQFVKKKNIAETADYLCKQVNMSWSEAEDVAKEVQKYRKGAIAQQKLIPTVFGSLIGFAIGVIMVVFYAGPLENYGVPLLFEEQLEDAIEGAFESVGFALPFNVQVYQDSGMIGMAVLVLGVVFVLIAILSIVSTVLSSILLVSYGEVDRKEFD